MDIPFGIGRSNLTGPVVDGICVRQSFRAVAAELQSVKIAFATYCRENGGEMSVSIVDPRNNSVVGKSKVMVAEFVDNELHEFPLNIELIPGRPYELRLGTLNCRSGSSVTAKYCRKRHEGFHLFIGARLIKDGELTAVFRYMGEEVYTPPTSPELVIEEERKDMVEDEIAGLVSVVIPHLNCYELLSQCLASLVRQTYSAIEVIVVDDGSAEPGLTQSIVHTFSSMIATHFISHGKNKGAPAARNQGARYARGEYILFLDADCMMYPDAFQAYVEALLEDPEASWAYGGFRWGHEQVEPMPFDADKLMGRNFISTMSMIRRKDAPEWDEALKRHQDWDLWLTMLEADCTAISTGEYMFETPQRKGSISTDGNIDMMKSIDIVRSKHGL